MHSDDHPVHPPVGEAAAERAKGKRPWSKPHVKVIEVNFTRAGGTKVPMEGVTNVSSNAPQYRSS